MIQLLMGEKSLAAIGSLDGLRDPRNREEGSDGLSRAGLGDGRQLREEKTLIQEEDLKLIMSAGGASEGHAP